MSRKLFCLLALVLVAAFVLSGCAAGTERFSLDSPAGFWAGLWHGIIIVITFIIGLFSDTVRMYESNNVGNLYDLGFLLGAMISLGGVCGSSSRRRKSKSPCVTIGRDLDDIDEKEWEAIATRIEGKVKRGIKSWLSETEGEEDDWGRVAADIEAKIKRELKDWSEE